MTAVNLKFIQIHFYIFIHIFIYLWLPLLFLTLLSLPCPTRPLKFSSGNVQFYSCHTPLSWESGTFAKTLVLICSLHTSLEILHLVSPSPLSFALLCSRIAFALNFAFQIHRLRFQTSQG